MPILRNKGRCLKCGDIIESHYRHDYKECSCGECTVDGGKEYLRRSLSNYFVDESITIPSFDDVSIETTEALLVDFYRFFDNNSGVNPEGATIKDYVKCLPEEYNLGNPYILALNFMVRNRKRLFDLVEERKENA